MGLKERPRISNLYDMHFYNKGNLHPDQEFTFATLLVIKDIKDI
jgi:hypothetical protein